MNKLLLDTNVLIYAIDEDSKYFAKAHSLFFGQFDLYTTLKNISEFLSVITRIPNPLTLRDALKAVEDFSNHLKILYPNEQTFRLYKELILKYKPVGLQIHDFEIISTAITHNINTIVTFNEKDFVKVREIKLFNI